MSLEKLYRIETCIFKKDSGSSFEPGLLLSEGTHGIIDMNGNLVKEVWTWKRESSFALDLIPLFETMLRSNLIENKEVEED